LVLNKIFFVPFVKFLDENFSFPEKRY